MFIRAASVTFTFVVLLGLIVILARATAVGTSGPWFSPAVSMQVYAVALLASIVVVVSAALAASARAVSLDAALRSLELQIVAATYGGSSGTGGIARTESVDSTRAHGGDVREVLKLLGPRGASEREGGIAEDDSALRTDRRGMVDSGPIGRELIAQRFALKSARARVWSNVVGPIAVSTIFAGIASAMLPGSEAFALNNYVLNTTSVLILSYGLWILVAWFIVSLVALTSGAAGRRPRRLSWDRI